MTESNQPAGPSSPAMKLWSVAALVLFVAAGFVWWRGKQDANPDPKPAPPANPFEMGGESVLEKPTDGSEENWETEAFASAADKQLKHIGHAITDPDDPAHWDELVQTGFQCQPLRPAELTPVFADASFHVLRAEPTDQATATSGSEGLASTVAQLVAPFQGLDERHVKFKITSVEQGKDFVETDVVYQAAAHSNQRSVQQSAVWRCRWAVEELSDLSEPPRLQSLSMTKFEEVVGKGPVGTVFADCTESVFRNEDRFAEQFMTGIDHWRSGMQSQYGVYPYGHHGLAISDVNQDGLQDIYVCQPQGLPNRLYLQQKDGTIKDVAQEMGVDWLDRSRGALLVDLDNDGDQDLVVAVGEMVVLLSNEEGKQFVERDVFRPTGDPGSLTVSDYDADGDLDLYVVNYGKRFLADGESSGPVPYHDANNGGQNALLRNDGDWTFVDVTRQCGMDENNRRWSFAAGWEDYDNDGDPDLYVANDFGRNNLYRNDNGTFKDVAAEAGVEDIAAGMSVSWADVNRDGHMDLYVGNMFSSAGLRIARQERFQSTADNADRSEFQRHARGNSLFINRGDGTFEDVSESAGVTLGRWAWSSPFIDINNDGYEDIVIANGFVTGSDTDDL